jgi:hypothetical protein
MNSADGYAESSIMGRERRILLVGGVVVALLYYGFDRHDRRSALRLTSETHLGSVGASSVAKQPPPVLTEGATADDARVRAILAEQHARHSFSGKVSEFGGATTAASLRLAIPTSDWRRLSIADRASIVRYMDQQPARARRSPEQYIDISRSAPLYPTIVERVSKISDGDWFVMGGQVVEHGTDMDEGDILACGDRYDESGCDASHRASALLAKWKQ